MADILFICGGRLVPASRFRVDPIAQGLRLRGHTARTIYGYGELDQRLGNGRVRWGYRAIARVVRATRTLAAYQGDPVVVQRLALPWNSLPEVSLGNRRPLIFDFDDAVFLDANGKLSYRRMQALHKVWKASAHVVAGNSWLASFAREHADVSVVPTCIDTQAYTPVKKSLNPVAPVRIGWIGTAFNQKYLEKVIPALLQLKRESYPFEFVICSDVEPLACLDAVDPIFVKWSVDEELAVLQSFDIGIMPLENDDWCKGKCSFKAIQYLAVGVPVVASAVGFNVDVVKHGKQGFLVAGNEWYETIKKLIDSSSLREAMGKEARLRACENFDIKVAIRQYEKIISAVS